MIPSMEAVRSEWWERKWEQGDSESREMLQLGTGHILFERMRRERSFNTAWIQIVLKTPRSRARSQSFGQLTSWLEAILCTKN